jgi:hypothetical protein
MTDLLSTAHTVLRDAGFKAKLSSADRTLILSFEDEVIIGFVCVFSDPAALLARWRSAEMSLLARYAQSIRAAGDKAWNVYCAFLCASAGSSEEERQIRWIEEDLERTRKIAGCGLTTREEIVRVLLPLLPLQYQATLEPEDVNRRFQRLVDTIAPKVAGVILDDGVPAREVIRILGEPS